MNAHIEHPTAYQNAIRARMIRNGVVGRLQRLAEEAPMIRRLMLEVVEPARRRDNEAYNAKRTREAARGGYDYDPQDYYPLFELDTPDGISRTASFVTSVDWHDMSYYSFPEQLVLQYLKTKKGLSEKQMVWVVRLVEEEPEREAKAQERRAARAAADAASTYIGNVGDRLKDMEVTVEFTKTIEGHWSSRRIVKMRDPNQNLFVTFATSRWVWEAEKGAKYILTGTVKAHEEYEGAKQTILTRTKAVSYEEVS